eukprot:CAMPEP_0179059574 /NCGR_PEP_ID=MMETSP0796-20121207/25422_1 /TAXON_ID=73915 /ORGANISM="Pyrodinium bahamense, Strain pbaha01" /LENGTH=234 /DNA_ID=CAMNT_0020756333 /DNA_START=67 /DNA_END=768 /DNA_ORIENTATION=-
MVELVAPGAVAGGGEVDKDPALASAPEPLGLAGPLPPQKRVVLVRHGEGHHNASRNWKLVDPRLTDRGLTQARALHGHPDLVGAELVVVSPLARAVQTALEAFRPHPTSLRFALSALHSEVAFSRCDRGRLRHEVAADFPEIRAWEGFEELPEQWMHPRSDRSHWRERRLPAFRAWLAGRPERHIVVVGHGEFFHGLCGRMLDNCEVCNLGDGLPGAKSLEDKESKLAWLDGKK